MTSQFSDHSCASIRASTVYQHSPVTGVECRPSVGEADHAAWPGVSMSASGTFRTFHLHWRMSTIELKRTDPKWTCQQAVPSDRPPRSTIQLLPDWSDHREFDHGEGTMTDQECRRHLGAFSFANSQGHRVMRLIFEPSRLKLYISPCGSRMKAMTRPARCRCRWNRRRRP